MNDEDAASKTIEKELEALSDVIDPGQREVSVVLAAGHGKRIKSEKPKMLHEIWGKPSVRRVCTAAQEGLGSDNQVVVVGIKAREVARALGRRKNRVFVFQEEQRGTGDAVRKAITSPHLSGYTGDVYVFPGDMGLLSGETVARFKEDFLASRCDMLVMTGLFEGPAHENYYGRILPSKRHKGEIVEIKEYKDILALPRGRPYTVSFKNAREEFGREELLEIREFNTGVYAFKMGPLQKHIPLITTDNVQGEVYVTDLIKIFNDHGLAVRSSQVKNNSLVVGFNVKSVLKKMEQTYREMVYERLKDIVSIDDADDFFIAEETVGRILEMDGLYESLDIRVGKGAYIGERVLPNRGLDVGRNAILDGNIRLGERVSVGEGAIITNYHGQLIEIGSDTTIFRGNVIQGQISIGSGVRLETGVRVTGSSADPVAIGNNVLVKGMTYIYGSVIEDDVLVEHSILKKVRVYRAVKRNGEVQAVRYILPHPEGLDSIQPIP